MSITRRRTLVALSLAALLVLSGCSAFSPSASPPETTTTPEPTSTDTSVTTPDSRTGMEDPEQDVLGWEDGRWHDEPLTVDNSDGLNQTELDAVVARSMARVEHLRNAEYNQSVTVDVKSREDYRNSTPFSGADTTHSDWNNQVWEGLFIVDDPTNVTTEFQNFYSGGVLGYYAPSTGELVIVSDDTSALKLSESTLIHELAHALQDQRFDLTKPKYSPTTQDEQLASNGLIEGEAKYIENKYREQCKSKWDCLEEPSSSAPSNGNIGIQLTLYQPYADGEDYIAHLIQTEGWSGVDARFETPPTKTAEIIHPDRSVPNHSFDPLPSQRNGWSTFATQGEAGADSLGEASVFTMMWYQNHEYRISTIPEGSIRDSSGDLNYEHSVSTGLINDRMTPYKNGEKRGYVWRLQWRTDSDATEFKQMYETVLRGHGATKVNDSTWVISEGGYADAFHVTQEGRTVVIANAPQTDDLADIRPQTEPTTETQSRSLARFLDMRTLVIGGLTVGGVATLALFVFKQ